MLPSSFTRADRYAERQWLRSARIRLPLSAPTRPLSPAGQRRLKAQLRRRKLEQFWADFQLWLVIALAAVYVFAAIKGF